MLKLKLINRYSCNNNKIEIDEKYKYGTDI